MLMPSMLQRIVYTDVPSVLHLEWRGDEREAFTLTPGAVVPLERVRPRWDFLPVVGDQSYMSLGSLNRSPLPGGPLVNFVARGFYLNAPEVGAGGAVDGALRLELNCSLNRAA